jgi:glycosyltransferase involved in cell wall biosynthesis
MAEKPLQTMGHMSMSRKLKVAVFNTQPPHLYFGGVERRIVEVAKRLLNEVDTTVYSGTKRGFKKTTVIDGVTVVPCFSTDRLYPLDNWVFNRSISGMFDKIEADVYEAHTVSGYKFLKLLKKQKTGKPFIQTVHGVLADEHIQSSKSMSPSFRMKLSNVFMRRLAKTEKEAAKAATLIVTVSQYSAQKLTQLYDVDEAKIRVVPNGVDTQRFKPTPDCKDIKDVVGGNNKNIVLFVGNLIPRKGLHYLIEAAKHVVKERDKTKFVVVGEGPLKSHLTAYCKEQGVSDKFVFLGGVPEELLHRLYNCADVFVSPSIQEGQGITLLEAQATAKPVVAFNVTAITEVVKNKETGLLVTPDSSELADAISTLLNDKPLREKMGRSGREFVSKTFSWDVCAQKMSKVYSEAAEH